MYILLDCLHTALKESSAKIAPKNSTILITRVSVGKTAFADDDYAINQDMTALIPSDKLHPLFLFYFSEKFADNIERDAQGIGVRGVTQKYVAELMVTIPPLSVQQDIVDNLNKEMEIIAHNKELIGILEKKIKSRIAKMWDK